MDYRPSTTHLYAVLGKPLPRLPDDPPGTAEAYAVYAAALEVSGRNYGALAKADYERGPWSAPAPVLDAMRAALADTTGTYAAQGLALALAMCEVRDAEVVAALHPWHAIALHWATDGYTAAQIGHLIQAAEAAGPLSEAAARQIDAWIGAPWTALFAREPIQACLFGDRLTWGVLVDNGFCPAHDELIARLAASAVPPLPIGAVSQRRGDGEVWKDVTDEIGPLLVRGADGAQIEMRLGADRPDSPGVYSDGESHWVVSYEREGVGHEFICQSLGTRLDLVTVMAHFDRLMARSGRADAVYRLDPGLGENGEWGFFVIADRDRFPRAASLLHLPLAVD